MDKRDILIFLSDQHNALYSGFVGHSMVRTPNLDRIADDGTTFNAAYTSCPLCVPARMSLLSGQLPSRTGIFTNQDTLSRNTSTFIHSLAAAGYETVLCGRMHFIGEDQRHGFTKRIMGDITNLYTGSDQTSKELGPYQGTIAMTGCLNIAGGGNSPVLEYDRAVINAALKYLKEDHQKPQCIVVGTYGPHFPYVASPELYKEYLDKLSEEDSQHQYNYEQPLVKNKEQRERYSNIDQREEKVDSDLMLRAKAAYFGMITELDAHIGNVYDEWHNYLERKQVKGLFVYLSDHGDTCGDHYIFGKQTFYEGSARIPMIFAGDDIKSRYQVGQPVSIMDIGPTLCEMVSARHLPIEDGESLLDCVVEDGTKNNIPNDARINVSDNPDNNVPNNSETNISNNPDRYVFSEFMEKDQHGKYSPGRMIRKGKWKLISYAGHIEDDLLFNLEEDPDELINVLKENQDNEDLAQTLRDLIYENWDVENIVDSYKLNLEHIKIINKWGRVVEPDGKERWVIPEKARQAPVIR